jgi:hypothetical protein
MRRQTRCEPATVAQLTSEVLKPSYRSFSSPCSTILGVWLQSLHRHQLAVVQRPRWIVCVLAVHVHAAETMAESPVLVR